MKIIKINCFLFFFAACFSLITVAQNKTSQQTSFTVPKMPIDNESKLINYHGVVEVPGTQAELYKRALAWFNSYYKNPVEKLRNADSVNYKIEGFIRFKIYNPENKDGLKTDAGMVQYSILLDFKDGKFRYSITNLNWKQTSYYAIEKWLDKNDKYYTPFFDFYLIQTDDEAKQVIKDISSYMKKPPVKKQDNW